MTGKLWAFGDSYTAGAELGTRLTENQVRQWLFDTTGMKDIYSIKAAWGNEKYIKQCQRKWYEFINHRHDKSFTYAGIIAKEKNLEHINCAVSGSSIQFFYAEFKKHVDKIDWDNDIVILGTPPALRWMSRMGAHYAYHSFKRYNPRISKILPSQEMISTTNLLLLQHLQLQYPKLIVLDLGMNDVLDKDIRSIVVYNNKERIDDIADSLPFGRYPGYHPTEEAHVIFADYLLKEVL